MDMNETGILLPMSPDKSVIHVPSCTVRGINAAVEATPRYQFLAFAFCGSYWNASSLARAKALPWSAGFWYHSSASLTSCGPARAALSEVSRSSRGIG